MPFKKRDAATAVEIGKPSRTKRGEKMSPPPRPIMVKSNDETNIIGRRIKRFIAVENIANGVVKTSIYCVMHVGMIQDILPVWS